MSSTSMVSIGRTIVAKWVPAFILLGLGIVGFRVLFAMRPIPDSRADASPAPKVNTTIADPYDGAILIDARGVVVPHRELFLSAEVSGRIAYKNPVCQTGQWVAKDTELLRIDDRELQLEARRIQAEVRQADVQIQELDLEVENTAKLVAISQRDVELMEREMARMEQLRNTIPVSQIEQSERTLNQSRNALLTQENQYRLLGARRDRLVSARDLAVIQLERAELDLARTVIKAPSDGVIVTEQVEEGSYVQTGTQLIGFEDTTKVEVEFTLRVNDVYWLLQDRRAPEVVDQPASTMMVIPAIEDVRISFDIGGETLTWSGRLEGFARHGVDERTRNVMLRAVVDNPTVTFGDRLGVLRRDMFVQVEVPVFPRANLVVFPASSLKAGDKVWVVRDSKLKILPVRVAGRQSSLPGRELPAATGALADNPLVPANSGWVIVMQEESGLRSGDSVISSPLLAPFDGMSLEDVGTSSMSSVPASESDASPGSTAQEASDDPIS